MSGAQYTATASASVSGATYGFTSSIDSSSDTCLRHSTKAIEQCSNVSNQYKIPLVNTISPEDSNNSTATLTLTSKATTSVSNVAGEYGGVVTVTVMAKDPPPIFTPSTATMQNFTTTECDMMTNYNTTTGELLANSSSDLAVATLTGKNTLYLNDSRNNQLYRVRKMQDGKCWMIDNLKIYNKTLTSADSDIASGSFTLPATLNTAGSSVNNAARVDDPTATTYCTPTTGGAYTAYPNTTTGCGYLYNWYTATAGKGTASLFNVTVTDSICPKNWGLPTGGPSGSGGQFETLNNAISLIAGGGQSFQAPYSGNLTTGGFPSPGSYGYYWSSRADASTSYAYGLYFYSWDVHPTIYFDKYLGHAIRCIL